MPVFSFVELSLTDLFEKKLTNDDNDVNIGVQLFIHQVRCIPKIKCYEEKTITTFLYKSFKVCISASA